MSKSNRKFTARQNLTSFDPSTTARAREDLRSTDRPHDINEPERTSGRRGLTTEKQSE